MFLSLLFCCDCSVSQVSDNVKHFFKIFFENFLKVAIFKDLRLEKFFWKMFWTDFWKIVEKWLKCSVCKGLKGFWKNLEKILQKNLLKKIWIIFWFFNLIFKIDRGWCFSVWMCTCSYVFRCTAAYVFRCICVRFNV